MSAFECKSIVTALESLNVKKTKELVFHLGVPLNTLDDLEISYRGNDLKTHFLQEWLSIDTDASWEKLAAGLREIHMNVLAEQLPVSAAPPATMSMAMPNGKIAFALAIAFLAIAFLLH